ncbi:MAG: glycosyltransferase, partial [Cytophagaceae bacterium]
FNEAQRLDLHAWQQLGKNTSIRLIFVDDGSTDKTLEVLHRLVKELPPKRSFVLALERNRGKGETVRAGLAVAMTDPASWVGYVDADLATPASEISRIVQHFVGDASDVVIGSRVRLLGHEIKRHFSRFLMGRVFATTASALLSIPVYDTQCGCKFFRKTPQLSNALRQKFISPWLFDVELIGRLLYPTSGKAVPLSKFLEVPLRQWHDVSGSKVRRREVFRICGDLGKLWWSINLGRPQGDNLVGESAASERVHVVKRSVSRRRMFVHARRIPDLERQSIKVRLPTAYVRNIGAVDNGRSDSEELL